MESWLQAYDRLEKIFREMGSVLVAYSGGVDSTLLAKAAHETLGEKAIAVTAASPTIPSYEISAAREVAVTIGIRHRLIESHEMDNPKFSRNDTRRCYFCKTELFERLFGIAKEEEMGHLVYGVTLDDLGDFRPGIDAAREKGVRSPLVEAGLNKAMVREISRQVGLPNWDKPSAACLSSRFPYGTEINLERLSMVEEAERFLKDLGFRQFRVRYHGQVARIEVEESEVEKLMHPEIREKIVHRLKELGFLYITLDLQGYRTGSMNEGLPRFHGDDRS